MGKKTALGKHEEMSFFELKIVWHIPNHRFCIFRNKSAQSTPFKVAKNTNVPICFSWLNCALQGIEAMFWVSMRLFEACVTDVWQTDFLTNKMSCLCKLVCVNITPNNLLSKTNRYLNPLCFDIIYPCANHCDWHLHVYIYNITTHNLCPHTKYQLKCYSMLWNKPV